MADPRRLVVVGASLAGLRAVEAARSSGFDGEIVLVGAEEHLPYDRPPLSKKFLTEDEVEPVFFRTREHLVEELGVILRLGEPALALDAAERAVMVGSGSVRYDALVLATGSTARTLPYDGVLALRTLDDARRLRRAVDDRARIVVIGAGLIGSEIASSAASRGAPTVLLEGATVPLVRAVGAEMGEVLADLHRRHGTDFRAGVTVSAVRGEPDGFAVDTDRVTILADLVVAGIGASPNVDWLDGSGVKLDDGVVCDEHLWTGLPGVHAAGDIARWHNPEFGSLMRLENWTAAAEQGAVAARNALGEQEAYRTIPYFWTDWYDTRIQFVGVPEADQVVMLQGSVDEGRFVAGYRTGERLTGALCVGLPSRTMKYRALMVQPGGWELARELGRAAPRNDTLTLR
jgi:NADPH-dependent 2,4-dienoyl-CoA reductase/sulfur reductase-like enzyme